MMELMLVLGAIVSLWLTGVALTTLLHRGAADPDECARPEFHGLSLLLGIGVIAWGQFLWSLAGGGLSRGVLIAVGLAGSAFGAGCLWRRRSPSRIPHSTCCAWSKLAILSILAVWVSLLVQTLLTPQRLWDERAIFGIKAAVLSIDESIDSSSLTHPQFVQYHPRYPLLLPLAESYIYGWIGEVDDRWSKTIPALTALGLWLTFAGVLARELGRDRAGLFALLLATLPGLTTWEYGFLTAQADAVVAAYHGTSVLYLWTALRHCGSPIAMRGPSLVAGLLATCALFTKDEGIAFVLVDCAALGLWLVGRFLASIRVRGSSMDSPASDTRGLAWSGWDAIVPLMAYLIPVLSLGAFWFWHRRSLPTTTEMTYFDRLNWAGLRAGVSTLTWSGPHLVARMFREAMTWGLAWWGVLLGGLLSPRRCLHPWQVLLVLDICGALASLLVAGMLAPTPVAEHLGGSAHRFLLQIAPVAVLFLAGQMDEKAPAGRPVPVRDRADPVTI